MSRCQSFEFKSIPVNLMKEKIQYICDQEKIKIDNDALEQICIDSNGGLRDGIGLLDQLNSYTNGNIKKEDVLLLNGRLNEEDINSFINYIYNNEIDKAFNLSDKIDEDGKDYIFVCEDIIKYVKNSLIDYQINNDNELINKIGKDKAIDIIYQITDYINYIRNIKEKKIYFDLLIIKLLDIFNKTNVRVEKSVVSSVKKEKEIKVTTDDIVEKEKIEIKTETPIVDDKKYDNYKELMNIRLNNILRIADKESFKEYMDFFNNLENDLDNLDERKIFNLLLDCSIKAGSKDGIIITASNNNILNELYDNFKEIEDLFINKLSKDIKVCFYNEEEWNKKRSEYVKKIKNKENIDILDETKVLNKINKKDSSEKNEFEDLLEIGE